MELAESAHRVDADVSGSVCAIQGAGPTRAGHSSNSGLGRINEEAAGCKQGDDEGRGGRESAPRAELSRLILHETAAGTATFTETPKSDIRNPTSFFLSFTIGCAS